MSHIERGESVFVTTLARYVGPFCANVTEPEVKVEFDYIPAQMATAFTPYYEAEIDILSTSIPTTRDERNYLACEIRHHLGI